MRPPRIAILVLFFSASLFLFCRSISAIRRSSSVASPLTPQKSSLRSFFSFQTPFSLFPPNAAISLTDDNSTFFPARPAAFGPTLPAEGLSGQLWIGSGFADDNLQDGEGEGELGCSDVAGWEDGRSDLLLKATKYSLKGGKSTKTATKAKNSKRDDDLAKGPAVDRKVASGAPPPRDTAPVDDGTDDYLHQGFQQTKGSHSESTTNSGSSHADIQSIQETAEITGKVVLLSRGGCGFLEKVKWAQRRGAIALIVGDNQKGGPLIQMFARGNVDNVTIPSVFTSRTTAHLLSSLMQPGSFIEDILDENGNPILKVQQSGKARKNKKAKGAAAPAPPTPKMAPKLSSAKMAAAREGATPKTERPGFSRRSWVSRLFQWGTGDNTGSDRSRPPSSGRLDWVIVDDWSDEKDKLIKNSLEKASKGGLDGSAASASEKTSGDSFQIGVQDWRDPDLVGSSDQNRKDAVSGDAGKSADAGAQNGSPGASAKQAGRPKGGSITPGSGEYIPEVAADPKGQGPGKSDSSSGSQGGIMAKYFGDPEGEVASSAEATPAASIDAPASTDSPEGDGDNGDGHEGLWVTISPTSSASPFFDTLLVLVISPLVTLTVVYALLILRAKIRRRRWRAPKSVVERLPVRTYHTVARSPSQSSRAPSPTSSSPTTPLLQGSSPSRPRSRTTTGVPEPADLLRADNALQAPRAPRAPGSPSHEKGAPHISSEWKKYMGRQVECVVCLEEYVDGVSRVMSLPCGHEFHVECITPWLTTRRRTCPICKGDVVRSLARGSSSSPRYEPYRDDSDDEPSGSGSASGADQSPFLDQDLDVEARGFRSPSPSGGSRAGLNEGWFSALSSSVGGQTSRNRREESRENRDR
ncbi:hypothetical protein B0T22DRAFT_110084 [Podospora appendiculata]|uniref:RING-type E3 ubiquitin transferase n=1 Tax=Podospora appendiculata TaxID=314037 RepID=A0AAE0XMD1_9PEZI|nr:hypothetical protein B0T22DRAFT_110084 [Podospora appendiculata]